jgi:hypothetical protein
VTKTDAERECGRADNRRVDIGELETEVVGDGNRDRTSQAADAASGNVRDREPGRVDYGGWRRGGTIGPDRLEKSDDAVLLSRRVGDAFSRDGWNRDRFRNGFGQSVLLQGLGV